MADKDAPGGPAPTRKVLSTDEAAAYLGIGKTMLYSIRKRKLIKTAKIGWRTLWPVKELDRYIELVTTQNSSRPRNGKKK